MIRMDKARPETGTRLVKQGQHHRLRLYRYHLMLGWRMYRYHLMLWFGGMGSSDW